VCAAQGKGTPGVVQHGFKVAIGVSPDRRLEMQFRLIGRFKCFAQVGLATSANPGVF